MKKLLIVGGSDKQLPIITRAKELGYYTLCIDGNPNSIGFLYADTYKVIDIKKLEECYQYALKEQIDGVTTLSSTATLPAVSYIAEKMQLTGISHRIAENLKSKYKMKEILYQKGLNVKSEFFEIHSKEEWEKRKTNIELPIVVKPSDGSASKGVSVVKEEYKLESAIQYALKSSKNSSVYIEPYIEGEEYGVESFTYQGEVYILGVIKQTMKMGEDGLLDYGHCVPSGLPIEIEERIKQEVKKAIQALGIQYGSVNMDIILGKDERPYIIDIGPRIGLNLIASHIIPYSTGVNIIDNTIKSALGEEVSFQFEKNEPVATRVLIMKAGKIKKIENIESLIKDDVLDIILKVKEGDIVKEYKTKSDACGWVIAKGSDTKQANENAYKAKQKLNKMFYIEEEMYDIK